MAGVLSHTDVKPEFQSRWRAQDFSGVLDLIADDAVYFWSNGSALFGKAAIAEGLRANFESIKDDTYEVSDVIWLVESADVAACVYRFSWTGVVDGQPASGTGRGASVLRRGPGGWQVVHENLSTGAWR